MYESKSHFSLKAFVWSGRFYYNAISFQANSWVSSAFLFLFYVFRTKCTQYLWST